jgi:hypothetical protein
VINLSAFISDGNAEILASQTNMLRVWNIGRVLDTVMAQTAGYVPPQELSDLHEEIAALWLGTPPMFDCSAYNVSFLRFPRPY